MLWLQLARQDAVLTFLTGAINHNIKHPLHLSLYYCMESALLSGAYEALVKGSL